MAQHRHMLIIAALMLLLATSLTANAWLYQRADQYYHELNRLRLDPLDLQSFSRAETANDKPTVVFIGDSRAAEWPAPTALPHLRFMNRGIGGQTSAQVIGRFDAHVTPLQPKIIIIQVGINDLKTIPLFSQDTEQIITDCKAHLAQLIEEARRSGATVIITTIIPPGRISLTRQLYWSDVIAPAVEEVNRYIKGLAQPGVVVFDTATILADPHGQTRDEYRRDSIHLNTAGYAALNQALVPILRDLVTW